MKRLILTVVLIFGLALSAWGGLKEGEDAYLKRDYATAIKEFLPFAEQGHAGAQHILGVMYSAGRNVPQDYVEALKWFRKAAEQGNDSAQFCLGRMYDKGEGVPQDHAEAARWYQKAAEQGNDSAQFFLGFMYYLGEGVPQDYVQAHMWSNLAAAQGSLVAADSRDKTAELMTREQIAEAQRLAREWKPKVAVPGD